MSGDRGLVDRTALALRDLIATKAVSPVEVLDAHLSEIERVCFVLKHLEQWRLKEIADELNTNTGAVKQAIFRAVRKLRVRMTGLQGDMK